MTKIKMNFEDLGFNDKIKKYLIDNNFDGFNIGRIVSEHKERYIVKTMKGEFEAEITGNLRFSAKSREDFPAVGDWVTLSIYDSEFSLIHHIIPRLSFISRQAVGHFAEEQIIATNIDYALLIQAIDRDFNINRLERYLTICYSSKVTPIILLNKIDLISEQQVKSIVSSIKQRIGDVEILSISNETKHGFDTLKNMLQKGKTYCMLGSSGVGKSTLINNLANKQLMKTNNISASTNKGRHITSHRELIVLENGAIIIDNPGMREIGIMDKNNGLENTFDKIFDVAKNCKFKDCTHTIEIGCCVKKALENGEIDKTSYENYLKMQKEITHFEISEQEKRRKDKEFGKLLKNFKKSKNKFDF